jgi:Zn-dependent membrane protease YugP
MFPLFWDPTLILVIPGFILALWAQFKVKRTFARYDEFGSRSGWTADQVARDITAAAWTYVASALVAVLHLFRLLILSGLLGGSDE